MKEHIRNYKQVVSSCVKAVTVLKEMDDESIFHKVLFAVFLI